MNATVSVICYKVRPLKNGEYPLVLRITKDGKRKYQYLGVSIDAKFWDFNKNRPKPNCPNKDYISKIILDTETDYQKKILELNAEQKDYTAASLVESKTETYSLKTVREFYEELIDEFDKWGKIGNKRTYKASLNCLKRFTGNKLEILFSDIDFAWLNRYEEWFRIRGCKETFMSIQFRTLRSAYNKAITAHVVALKHYPFNDFKVSKFNVKTKKRALTKADILKVITTETINPTPLRILTRNVFTFSYLCGGISCVDIANLTISNIQNGRISYYRQKTGSSINLKLGDQAREIIEQYKSYRDQADYLFPIYDKRKHITPIQKHNRLNKVEGKINKELKVLASELEIDANLTTYVARHTFATVLRRAGVDIGIISESLGHTELSTTQIYLDSFENEQMDDAMSKLL